MTASMVYFMQGPAESDPIKIGISVDPDKRLKEVQTGSAVPLRILRLEPGGRRRETQLHRRFAAHRLHGEWFTPAPELVAYIRSEPGAVPRLPDLGAIGDRIVSSLGYAKIPARGAWRIIAALILLVVAPRRRRRHRLPATYGLLAAAAAAAGHYLAPNLWIPITAASVAAATILAGVRR